MASSDGGGPEDAKEPTSAEAVTSLILPAEGNARVQNLSVPAKVEHTPSQPSVVSQSGIMAAMTRAVEASTPTSTTVVRFALGAPVGFVLSMVANALLTPILPLTAPMAFFLTLSLTMATAIFFARGFPLKDAFTKEELLRLERAKALYTLRMGALDQREEQMRNNGMTGREVETALGPERQSALEGLRNAIAAVEVRDGEDPHP